MKKSVFIKGTIAVIAVMLVALALVFASVASEAVTVSTPDELEEAIAGGATSIKLKNNITVDKALSFEDGLYTFEVGTIFYTETEIYAADIFVAVIGNNSIASHTNNSITK